MRLLSHVRRTRVLAEHLLRRLAQLFHEAFGSLRGRRTKRREGEVKGARVMTRACAQETNKFEREVSEMRGERSARDLPFALPPLCTLATHAKHLAIGDTKSSHIQAENLTE